MHSLSEQTVLKHGELIWKEFIEPFGNELKEAYPRLRDSCMLFGQATLAFDAGARMGAVILCRTALESALYTLRYTKRKGLMSWDLLEPPRNEKCEYEMVPLTKLLKFIKNKVTMDQLCELNRIKEDGDFVAHIADRLNREILQAETIEQMGKIRLWISDEEALKDLKGTAMLLQVLGNIAAKEPFLKAEELER